MVLTGIRNRYSRGRKPHLHSDRGQDSNRCARGSTVLRRPLSRVSVQVQTTISSPAVENLRLSLKCKHFAALREEQRGARPASRNFLDVPEIFLEINRISSL
ncbi:hypothetical protein E2C01_036892 [Portunus trituberculatus]|uniref:Uncharacterized protein n=1 Tax=Portunus trituberculatus TaxID=210409 RepID=A0A5B7F6N6_PORTR|nr:hypothetical protein [Portunus trituberculatus]